MQLFSGFNSNSTSLFVNSRVESITLTNLRIPYTDLKRRLESASYCFQLMVFEARDF